jgi:glycogen synthase
MATSVPQKLLVPLFFRIAWWYNLGTYWRCDRATAPSNAARDVLLASARKPFRAPVEVIPNGVDTERFRPDARVPDWRARCGLGDAPLVTYLGRLTADKGVHRFLDAVRKVATRRPIAALVGGTGPEEARVRERLRREEDLARRVRYVGPVAESEKSALLGQSDLFVLPSTSDTSSVALLEAMACGTTVVAPAVGGASEVVNPGVTGITTDVESPDALAATIDRLLREPDERSRIAAAAARWVRSDASLESMARRFISLYRVVLTERPRRAGRVPT